MVMSSLQICMDSSNWQEGLMQMDRCLKPQDHQNHMISAFGQRSSVKIIPQQQQQQQQQQQRQQENQQNNNQEALKCPRCDSTNTKFCYYNNYSLSQPRHFCKTCRRYWTRGGALRNVPVGGGCRKNKRNKRTLTAFDIRAASVIASSNPSSLSISLPTTSAIASDLLPGPFSQTQNHTNNSSILYGLPNTSNELNMAFTRINQLNLKNNPDYGLCLNINPDTQLPGLEFCSSRPTTGEELCPFGTSRSFLEGIDTPSVNETCISWNNSGSLNEAQKISLPHLQNQALGQFGEEEHKPKIKVDDGCRNMSQMVPVSSVADTNVFQSPADEGAHGNDQYWNIGEGGWPDLSSYGSVSSSLA